MNLSARSVRRRALVVGAVFALAAGAAWVIPTGASASALPPTIVDEPITSGGVQLGAEVFTPGGTGLHPLAVMPTPWDGKETVYKNVALNMVQDGFVVVAYTQRGFTDSGGQADLAGPATITDVSNVITWALANTPADPNHVGVLGFSYGAGVALLAAAQDSRIKAIASLSPWTDLAGALAPNDTLNVTALKILFPSTSTSHVLNPQVAALANTYTSDPATALDMIQSMSATRSPDTDVAALNANGTAIMLGSGFEDSLFPPSQLTSLYSQLTGPKRLDLVPGDHGQPEYNGLVLAQRTGIVGDAIAWLQHYLAGSVAGADAQPGFNEQDETGATNDDDNSPHVTGDDDTWPLGAPNQAGGLNGSASTWSAPLTTGVNSGADAPHEQMDIQDPYRYTSFSPSSVTPANGAVWSTGALQTGGRIDGTPQLQLTVSPTDDASSAATLYAYLYDVAPNGTGRLITAEPDTITDLTSTETITIALEPIDWAVAPGDSLALVVDTADPKWPSMAPSGSAISIAATSTAPASLAIPWTALQTANQTISFASMTSRTFGTSPFTVSATATSGLPVTFTATTGSACRVSGSQVTLTRAGTCSIVASQVGNSAWSTASSVTQTFAVNKARPTVRVTTPTHPIAGYVSVNVSVAGIAGMVPTGALKITRGTRTCTIAKLSSTGSGVCSVVATAGTATISAAYAGDANYLATSGSSAPAVGKAASHLTITAKVTAASSGHHYITLTVKVTAIAGLIPSGTIAIRDGTQHCTATLSSGSAHCTITVGTGTYHPSTTYSGDSNYLTATVSTAVRAG